MQRQRGELVPIGDALADLGGPVKAIRDASPQAMHHFTRFDQVNQLVEASEADPDMGFMARMMGTVQPAPYQSRQPAPVRPRERPLRLGHGRGCQEQDPLR